jgi:hypothetical protein
MTGSYFRNCSRELKRLDGITRSPLLSNVQVRVCALMVSWQSPMRAGDAVTDVNYR